MLQFSAMHGVTAQIHGGNESGNDGKHLHNIVLFKRNKYNYVPLIIHNYMFDNQVRKFKYLLS